MMSDEQRTPEEQNLAEELAARQAELDAANSPEPETAEGDGAPKEGAELEVGEEGVLEEPATPSVAGPVPPTAPAPVIGQEKPVAVERREGAGPVPAGGVDRIANPIGKRGQRRAERAERLVTADVLAEEEPLDEVEMIARAWAEERGADFDQLTDQERDALRAAVREEIEEREAEVNEAGVGA